MALLGMCARLCTEVFLSSFTWFVSCSNGVCEDGKEVFVGLTCLLYGALMGVSCVFLFILLPTFIQPGKSY